MYYCPSQRYTSSTLVSYAIPSITSEKHTSDATTPDAQDTEDTQDTQYTEDSNSNLQNQLFQIAIDHNYCHTNTIRHHVETQTPSYSFHVNRSTQTSIRCTNVRALRLKIRKLQARLKRVKRARQNQRPITPNRQDKGLLEDLPLDLKDLIQNQLDNFQKCVAGRRYTPSFYKNCFLLYHHSRRCYSQLRKILIMPSPSGLRRQLMKLFQKVSS